MIGKASEIRTEFVDADSVGSLQESINSWMTEYAPKNTVVIDIKYNMLTDPACGNQLYMTALIIYKEETP